MSAEAKLFGPPPAGTPIEKRLGRIECLLQAILLLQTSAMPESAEAEEHDVRPARPARHLYLVKPGGAA